MTERLRKPSYCPDCCKNVPHYRHVVTPLGQLLDWIARPLLVVFRVGPWFCLHCDRRQWWLTGRRRNAMDYRAPTAGVMNSVELSETPAKAQMSTNDSDSSNAETVADVPIGNYIKSEKSLVMRSRRLLRFSEKYRDAIVLQLLSREASMADIQRKHDISDAELVDWIADRFQRLEKELEDRQSESSEPPVLQIVAKSKTHGAIPPR